MRINGKPDPKGRAYIKPSGLGVTWGRPGGGKAGDGDARREVGWSDAPPRIEGRGAHGPRPILLPMPGARCLGQVGGRPSEAA